jgi:hypothetical protein
MNGSPFLPLIDSGKISEKMTHGNVATKNGFFCMGMDSSVVPCSGDA